MKCDPVLFSVLVVVEVEEVAEVVVGAVEVEGAEEEAEEEGAQTRSH